MHQEKELQQYIVKIRRDLHQIPEVGTYLPKTSAYICTELDRLGIPYVLSPKDSGILATIHGRHTGKTLVLRTDMDALEILEELDVPFKSRHPGRMHACGHDAHMAILLCAAKLLQKEREKLYGNVRLIFQTGEEISRGAEIAISNGWLKGANAVFGLHVGNLIGKEIPTGTLIFPRTCCMASYDKFIIKVRGMSCHGSTPERGIDPVNIVAHLILALQSIQTREIAGTDASVVTIGKIHGGAQYNVIPDEVVLEGTIRALDNSVRQYVAQRIRGLSASTAAMFGGGCECEIVWGAPPVINNEEMAMLAASAASNVFGRQAIVDNLPIPRMVGEDFANYLQVIPGAFFFLSTSDPEKGTDIPHHNPKFDVDESVLWRGAETFYQIALKYLR